MIDIEGILVKREPAVQRESSIEGYMYTVHKGFQCLGLNCVRERGAVLCRYSSVYKGYSYAK